MKEHEHKGVDATVVGVDPSVKPIESVVVGDKRNTLGKRLGIFALALLVLFFAIGGYIEPARNGRQLDRADRDRSQLIESTQHLSRVIKDQNVFIRKLQVALRQQNEILREAGFQTVPIPTRSSQPSSGPGSNPRPQPSSSKSPNPRPRPSHSPGPGPNPSPSPTPNLIDKARDRVCELTGVCPLALPIFFRF